MTPSLDTVCRVGGVIVDNMGKGDAIQREDG